MSEPAKVNQYDARNYTRKGENRRVVIREKSLVKSRFQRAVDFLRPSMRPGFNIVTSFELSKVLACIVFPVFMLLYWKYIQKDLPDTWERQFGGLQHRQFREDQLPEQDTDYFSIMSTFQERRDKALEKKRKDVENRV